jgi:hypothetical protein
LAFEEIYAQLHRIIDFCFRAKARRMEWPCLIDELGRRSGSDGEKFFVEKGAISPCETA